MNLEKSRQNRKIITSLMVNNQHISDPDEILKAESNFYEQLYTQTDTEVNYDHYIEDIPLENKLTDDEANLCEGKITLEEAKSALFGMKLQMD